MMSIYDAKVEVMEKLDTKRALEVCRMLDQLVKYKRIWREADAMVERVKQRMEQPDGEAV